MSNDTQQIFVGGCDRSGTTMLASMIGDHQDVNCLPESHFIAEFARSDESVSDLFDKITAHNRFKLWHLPLSTEDEKNLRACADFPSLINEFSALYGAHHNRPTLPIWLDHAPRSISAVFRLAEQFPKAKFIHTVRDGRAVAASWLGQDWGPRHILSVADTWTSRVGMGLAAERAMPDRVLFVKYEDVVAAPEAEMRRVAEFLKIDYDTNMLRARGLALPSHSKKTHDLLTSEASSGVSASRLDRWKTKLTERQIGLFEHQSGDLLPLLGYPLAQQDPKAPSRKEVLEMMWAEFAGRLSNIRKRHKRHSQSTDT